MLIVAMKSYEKTNLLLVQDDEHLFTSHKDLDHTMIMNLDHDDETHEILPEIQHYKMFTAVKK